jgi:phosphoribosylamine--glycine ligase
MRILFVSNDLVAGNLAKLLLEEGNSVKLHIQEEGRKRNFHNIVEKTINWKDELGWVGKKGLIVFDDIGFGTFQDRLRQEGFSVFGGSEGGDSLEQNRTKTQQLFRDLGMRSLSTYDFQDVDSALRFVKKNKKAWVIKQNGLASKSINYVGNFDDARDVIDVLQSYKNSDASHGAILTLQERVRGVEIAVMRFFNGIDWVGPMLINCEHKKFFPGDLGPTTSEMGTLGWYDEDESNKLFSETLAKMKPYLQKIGYRGLIDINSIVNENGAFPLEVTSRPGSPTVHLQSELNLSAWTEILSSVAKGDQVKMDYKRGYGVVVVIAVPPFPYAKKLEDHSQIGTTIYFDDDITKEEMKQVHFEEVGWDKTNKKYFISDNRGYVLYVTGHGSTVEDAQQSAYRVVKKIHIPKMFYRNDIGNRYINEDRETLKRLGYIS